MQFSTALLNGIIYGSICGTILGIFLYGLLKIMIVDAFGYVMTYNILCSTYISLGYFVGYSHGFNIDIEANHLKDRQFDKKIVYSLKLSSLFGIIFVVFIYGLLSAIGVSVSVHILILIMLSFVCFLTSYNIGFPFGYNARRAKLFSALKN